MTIVQALYKYCLCVRACVRVCVRESHRDGLHLDKKSHGLNFFT